MAMRARANIILGHDDLDEKDLIELETMLDGMSILRRSQVLVVIAMGYQALKNQHERFIFRGKR